MNPLVKKAVAAVAVKEIVDRIQEARKPKKPSLLARAGKLSLYGGLLAGSVYLVRSGKLQGIVERFRGGGYSEWPREGELSTHAPSGTPTGSAPETRSEPAGVSGSTE